MSELQSDENNYLLKKCKNFVSEIESYVGHDPLDAWYRYLLWFEDIFWINNADQETIFYKVLGQCLSCFENTIQYIQDRRLIRLFCKYITFQEDKLEHYKLLHENGFGTKVADLYLCWAQYYNIEDQFQDAERIFQLGLSASAEPRTILLCAHREFGFSMSQRLLNKSNEQFSQRNLLLMRQRLDTYTSIRLTDFKSRSLKISQLNIYIGNERDECVPFASYSEEMMRSLYPSNCGRMDPIPLRDSEEMFSKGVNMGRYHTGKTLPQRIANYPLFIDDYVGFRNFISDYNIIMLLPAADKSYSPEELRAYNWYKKNNITNEFTKEHAKVWENGPDVPIRWPPMSARCNYPQREWNVPAIKPNDHHDTSYPQKFGYNIGRHYPENSIEEYSIEELMWQKRKQQKQMVNVSQQLKPPSIIVNRASSVVDMDVCLDRTLSPTMDGKQFVNAEICDMPPATPRVSRISDVRNINTLSPFRSIRTKKSLNAENLEAHRELHATPFKPDFESRGFPKRKSSSTGDSDGLNDTCSTQIFNCFLKNDAISTPISSKQQRCSRRISDYKENRMATMNSIEEEHSIEVPATKAANCVLFDIFEDKTQAMAEIKETAKNVLSVPNVINPASAINDENRFVSFKKPNSPALQTIRSDSPQNRSAQSMWITKFEGEDMDDFLAEEEKAQHATPRKQPPNTTINQTSFRGFPADEQIIRSKMNESRKETSISDSLKVSFMVTDYEKMGYKNIKSNLNVTMNLNGTKVTPLEACKPEAKTHFAAIPEEAMNEDNDEEVMGRSIYDPPPQIEQQPQIEEEWKEVTQFIADKSVRNDYQSQIIDLDQTQQTIDMHMHQQKVDPFDKELQKALLDQNLFVDQLNGANNYNCFMVNVVPQLKVKSTFKIGDRSLTVRKQIGVGANGKVFSAECLDTKQTFALKQERPANLWEYYICLEVQSRIKDKRICDGLMSIDFAIIGNYSTIFGSQFSKYGTLLNVCNQVKKATSKGLDECIAIILANQMLSLVEHLHKVNIIHADLKPDNFLLMDTLRHDYDGAGIVLQLIDFGQSIDLNFFPPNQLFWSKLDTENFICTEMMEDKPWKFQHDYYCLASTIYTLVTGKYMKVSRQNGMYKPQKLPRYVNTTLWDHIFDKLINIPNAKALPKLSEMQQLLKDELKSIGARKVNDAISKFNNAILS